MLQQILQLFTAYYTISFCRVQENFNLIGRSRRNTAFFQKGGSFLHSKGETAGKNVSGKCFLFDVTGNKNLGISFRNDLTRGEVCAILSIRKKYIHPAGDRYVMLQGGGRKAG